VVSTGSHWTGRFESGHGTGSSPGKKRLLPNGHLTLPTYALMPYLWSVLAVATAVAAGRLLTTLTPFPNLSMIFLMAVLFPAVIFGIWPATFASVLSFLAYNFFFIEPIYTFTVAEPYELLALVIFLVIAVITSALAGRVREQARRMARRSLLSVAMILLMCRFGCGMQ
jgi:K+-sensing histidine kinase KdpD